MKKWNKIRKLSLLLAGLMVIGTGCGNNADDMPEGGTESPSSGQERDDGQNTAKGRYMETLKNTPEGLNTIEDMVRLSDGSVALINPDTGSLLISKDNGDAWEEKELPALAEKINLEEIEITSNSVAPDGAVFFSYVDWNQPAENGVDEKYVYIDKDGNASEIELTEPSGDRFYLSWAAFTGERTLAALMNGGYAYTIDLDSRMMNKISASEDGYEEIFLAGDYLMTAEWVYQLSAGNIAEDAEFRDFIKQESPQGRHMAVCFNSAENTVYSASKSGLYSHVLGGSSMEKLLDGGLCSLGDPTKTASAILQNEDGSFLIGYEDGEIDLYTYDAAAPAVPAQQISIFSMEQNLSVSRAVSNFRKRHPDVYVKQEVGLSGDYGVTKEDAIRNLNTRLLSGEGPDIILLDDMPLNSYIEKNMLSDLKDTIGELEKENNYFSDILHAYENEDGLYAVPIRFRVPVILGDKEAVSGVSDAASLTAAVKKAREKSPYSTTVLGAYKPEELLKQMYMMLAASEFVKDGEIDEAALKDFLTQAKEIYEEEQKNITSKDMQSYENTMQWQEENGMGKEEGNFPIDSTDVYQMLIKGQLLVIGTISSVEDLEFSVGMLEHESLPNMAYNVLSGQKTFSPEGICGISAKSEETELSLEFLKELLEMETQKADLADGLPVNADAFAKFFENPNPNDTSVIGFVASVTGDDGETDQKVEFTAEWPKESDVADLKTKIEELKTPGLSDDVIRSAILESGAKVLSGDVSVDEGCGEIVQKVDLYLAE